MRNIFYCLFFFPLLGFSQFSVLSSGDWYKLGVTETGVYKVDYNFLTSMGINPSTLDPSTIRVFGNGGGMLPQENAAFRYDDLYENPIVVIGEEDGVFDLQDYILFYGDDPYTVIADTVESKFDIVTNLYSDTTYYFLNVGQTTGKRFEKKTNNLVSGLEIDSYIDFQYVADDKYNLLNEGRKWYGDLYTPSGDAEHSYDFDLSGLVSGDATIDLEFMNPTSSDPINNNPTNISFLLSMNGVEQERFNLPARKVTLYGVKGIDASFSKICNVDHTGVTRFTLKIESNKSDARAYLDKLMVTSEKTIRLETTPIVLRHWKMLESNTLNVKFSSSIDPIVWDITVPVQAYSIEVVREGNQYNFQDTCNQKMKEYLIFGLNQTKIPGFFGRINNQNLHALDVPNAFIFTHGSLISEAVRLANFHRQNSDLAVEVVNVAQVYNEFSSGKQDVTAIRDFLRYFYLKDPTRLKYALMFGNCSYDYKNVNGQNANLVPIYEARESLDNLRSYSSEDYFGFMEDDEGTWSEENGNEYNHSMEIGIGRIPVGTVEDAKNVVDKIIRYTLTSNSFGDWRNRICFVADDEDSNLHQNDAEGLSGLVESVGEAFEIQKIYLDAFDQEPRPSGERSPAAKRALLDAINNGVMVLNFSGHGNDKLWMDEQIFVTSDIVSLKNRFKLPLFVTATCEFGRYDNPSRQSGAERLLFNPDGGAIGLFTTTRPVYSSSNEIMNMAFYEGFFKKENHRFRRLGDIIRDTKNNGFHGVNNRNFTLMGDPMLKLRFPELSIKVSEIWDQEVNRGVDTIRALSSVQVTSEITDPEGNFLSYFNGTAQVIIYDKVDISYTKGTKNANKMAFREFKSPLYRGVSTVKNGRFDVEFVVPKTIDYQIGNGKMVFYAWDDSLEIDAVGGRVDFWVGGSNSLAENDSKPPGISISLNSRGLLGEVGPNPLLIIELSDENGINLIENNLNQHLQMILDDEAPVSLTDYYFSEIDDFKKGLVQYPIFELTPGIHHITVKAWDTHGNAGARRIAFKVTDENKVLIYNFKSYPNPFSSSTKISFTHDRQEEDLSIDMTLVSQSGEIVSNRKYNILESPRVIELDLERAGSNGRPLRPGVYINRIEVRSLRDNAENQVHQRIMVID